MLHDDVVPDGKAVLRDARVGPHEGGLEVKVRVDRCRAAGKPVSCEFVGFQIR